MAFSRFVHHEYSPPKGGWHIQDSVETAMPLPCYYKILLSQMMVIETLQSLNNFCALHGNSLIAQGMVNCGMRKLDSVKNPNLVGVVHLRLLEPSRMGTYTKYPSHEFHVTRALSLLLAQQHTQ